MDDLEGTTQEWDRILSMSGRGAFLSYKYVAKQMISQDRGGSIPGAYSVAGKKG
jgi:meso-butanediol dehydrogenase / (S,S)-butanediol dehydrogenase / diacetyl reductase